MSTPQICRYRIPKNSGFRRNRSSCFRKSGFPGSRSPTVPTIMGSLAAISRTHWLSSSQGLHHFNGAHDSEGRSYRAISLGQGRFVQHCIFLFRPGYALGTRRVEQMDMRIDDRNRDTFRIQILEREAREAAQKNSPIHRGILSPCNWNTETSVRHRVNNVVDADPNSQCREFFRILRRIGPLP